MGAVDEVAYPRRRAVLGIQPAGPSAEELDLASQDTQLGDASIDLGRLGLEQSGHVGTGDLAPVPKGHHLAQLAQGEARRLAGPDEGQPAQGVIVVVAIAGGGPFRAPSRPTCS